MWQTRKHDSTIPVRQARVCAIGADSLAMKITFQYSIIDRNARPVGGSDRCAQWAVDLFSDDTVLLQALACVYDVL